MMWLRQFSLRLASGFPKSTSLVAGILSAFGFAPFHCLPLTLGGIAVFYHLCAQAAFKPKGAQFILGYSYGMGLFTVSLYWISYSLLVDIERFWWLIPFGVLGIPAVLSLFTGLCTVVFLRFPAPTLFLQPFWFAGVWTALEWVRGHLFLTGFPWNLMGYVSLGYLPFAQGASIVGVYGLSFIIVAFAASFSSSRLCRRELVRSSFFWLALLVVGLTAWGSHRLSQYETAFHHVRIRLVQPNIPQKIKWDFHETDRTFLEQMELSRPQGGETAVQMVILPESTLSCSPRFVEQDYERLMAIASVLGPQGLMIAGTPRLVVSHGGQDIFNGLIVVDRSARVVSTYDKAHLVPFGEYLPLRGVLEAVFPDVVFRKITAGERDFSPGKGLQSLDLGAYPSPSPLICYEVIFPHAVLPQGGARPQWLLNLTNDAWYGDSPGPYQHLQIARMRTIEEGVPLVRVANTGVSAVVDAVGRMVASIPLNTRGYQDCWLPKPLDRLTPYAQVGDAIFAIVFLLLAATNLLFFLRKKYAPSAAQGSVGLSPPRPLGKKRKPL